MKARLLAAVAIAVGATALAAALTPHTGHGTVLAPGSEYGEEHEATQTIGGATCGVERWPVKTLADANKAQVSFVVHPGTVHGLGALTPAPGGQKTRGPLEERVYGVTARLVKVKREADSDYHLVIKSAGSTMIAEMPRYGCTAGGTHRKAMSKARRALENTLGGPIGTSWHTANLHVRVTGVLFFDFAHGQTGHAPNYAELHPVIAFRVIP
jgi:hypothetical protein